jgi:hypothetical protein
MKVAKLNCLVVASWLLVGVCGHAVAEEAKAQLLVGAARVTITPKGPVWLAGYESNRRSEGKIGELYAACLAVQSGTNQKPLVIVSLDLIGLSNSEVNRIRALLPELPPENVVIACTHTHSGPDTIGLWGEPGKTGVDPEYMEFLRNRVVECIKKAVSSLKPASLRFAQGVSVSGVSKNVRVPQILDTELCAMQAIDQDGKPIVTLVNYACHPEIFHGKMVTADFPLYLYHRIEQKVGGVPMFLNGALGGMITADAKEASEESGWIREAERIGNTLADAAIDALSRAPSISEAAVSAERQVFQVPLENEIFKKAASEGLLPDKTNLQGDSVTTEVCHFTIGPAQFVGVPGEALPDIGFLLKRLMKGSPKFVIGLCNDELGYILSEENYGLKLYEYETSMSVGPQIGVLVKEKLRPRITAFQPPQTIPSAEQLTVAMVFQALPSGFNAANAKGVKAVYIWRVTGEGGGVWTIIIDDGKCTVKSGEQAKPDVVFEITARDFLDLITGKLSGMEAVFSGRLKIEGDLNLAAQFQNFFTPPQ